MASEEGATSVVRNASVTNTSHTMEVDPRDVTADTLRLQVTEGEFQPIDRDRQSVDRVDAEHRREPCAASPVASSVSQIAPRSAIDTAHRLPTRWSRR